jgi:hypothetical protein
MMIKELLSLVAPGSFRPPLLLTDEIIPEAADWHRVNRLLDHRRGCHCSTCSLAATLGHEIRRQVESSRSG